MSAPAETSLSSPLVEAVVSILAARIESGAYSGAEGFPSERELVDEFGASRTVIRRVLSLLESRELIHRAPRCRTVAREPAERANAVVRMRRSTIGLGMLASPYDPGMAAILHGINERLDHDAYRLVIGSMIWNSWESVQEQQNCFLERISGDQDICGVLLCYLGGEECVPALRKASDAGIPMVFFDRKPPTCVFADYVGVDNTASACEVVRHLIRLGHRRIAHITNLDPASTVQERLEGYRRALEEAGIRFDPELVVTATESSVEEVAPVYSALVERLMSLEEPVDAVFAVNDLIAQRLIGRLRLRDIRVPEDVAVAGFDGVERLSQSEPFITTAHQPFEQIGKRAASMLLARISSPRPAEYQQVMLQAPLRIHGSTLKGVEM